MATTRKVAAASLGGGVGGAFADILVWLLSLMHVVVPDNIHLAFNVLIPAGLAWLAGHYASDRPKPPAKSAT